MVHKIFKKTAAFSPLVFLLVAVNYAGDPAKLFDHKKYEQQIAAAELQGFNITILHPDLNSDERVTQKLYIDGLKTKNDVVVIGSSVSMQINKSMFPGKRFFNHFMSKSILRDYLAIFEMYRQKNLVPKTIIIETAPWLVNAKYNPTHWLSIAPYYDEFVALLNNDGKKSSAGRFENEAMLQGKVYLQLFSLNYFQSSVKSVFLKTKNNSWGRAIRVSYVLEPEYNTKFSDGSFDVATETQNRTVEQVLALTKEASYSGAIEKMKFNEQSEELTLLFEQFVNYLTKKESVKVIFFFPPFHPYLYDYFKTHVEYQMVPEVEKYFRKFAEEQKIQTVGFYDPKKAGIQESDFIDQWHLKRHAAEKLFKH